MDDKLYIRNIIREQIQTVTTPQLCPINTEDASKNMIKHGFGTLESHTEAGGVDLSLSRSLCLNGKTVGGYILAKASMPETIKAVIRMYKSGLYKDLKFFVDKDFLNKYMNKRGIYSSFLYINEEYNGSNYAKILIDYSRTIGDYVWGGSIPNKSSEYWLDNTDRIKIFQFIDTEDGKLGLFTATPV